MDMQIKTYFRFIIVLTLMPVIAVSVQVRAQEGDCWGNSRGDAALTGVSRATIPVVDMQLIFDAGYAAALGKSIITLHDPDLTHAPSGQLKHQWLCPEPRLFVPLMSQ